MRCSECQEGKVLEGHTLCPRCERSLAAERHALERSRLEQGLCRDCGGPPMPDRSLCHPCHVVRRKSQVCIVCAQPSGIQARCQSCRFT